MPFIAILHITINLNECFYSFQQWNVYTLTTGQYCDHLLHLVLHRYTSKPNWICVGGRWIDKQCFEHFIHILAINLSLLYVTLTGMWLGLYSLWIEAEVNGKSPNDLQPPSVHIFIDRWKSNKIQRNNCNQSENVILISVSFDRSSLEIGFCCRFFFSPFFILSFWNDCYSYGSLFYCLYDDKCDDFLGSSLLSPSPSQRYENICSTDLNAIFKFDFVR